MSFHIDRTKDGMYYSEQIRNGQVSSQELLMASFKSIKEQNALLNAVVHTREETALSESREESWVNGPFSGVPILLKELGQNMIGEPARQVPNC